MPGENIQSWSTTAATNATADTSIGWAEGQTRASVNDSARSMMAAIAKDRNLKNGSITTGGTANAQTFSSGLSYTSVPTGLRVRLKIGVTNTASATLNMDGIGAVTILDAYGNALGAGALFLGSYAEFIYNGTNWILLSVPYQEGTFTPGFSFGGGTTGITYTIQLGKYTKIGRVVNFELTIVLSSKGSSTGAWLVTGLPFTASPTHNPPIMAYMSETQNWVAGDLLQPVVTANATTISMYAALFNGGSPTSTALTDNRATNTTTLILNGKYHVT